MRGEVVEVVHRGLVFEVGVDGPSGGPPVVLLHGFPQDATAWDDVVDRLVGSGCRTITFDQRGYAPRARPPDRAAYRMHHLVGDVLAVLDDLDVSRVHVVGHDWGGAVAWALAIRRPARVATLTVLSTPHPVAMGRALRSSGQALRSWYVALFRTRFAESVVLPGLQRSLERTGLPPARAAHYASRMAEPGAMTGALNWYRAMPFSADVPDDATADVGAGDLAVHVPTTYAWGRDDPALGPRAALLTGDHVGADYRFEPLAAGHWLPEVVPGTVAALVLDRIDPPSAT